MINSHEALSANLATIIYIHQALEEYFTSCTNKTLFCKRETGKDKGLKKVTSVFCALFLILGQYPAILNRAVQRINRYPMDLSIMKLIALSSG